MHKHTYEHRHAHVIYPLKKKGTQQSVAASSMCKTPQASSIIFDFFFLPNRNHDQDQKIYFPTSPIVGGQDTSQTGILYLWGLVDLELMLFVSTQTHRGSNLRFQAVRGNNLTINLFFYSRPWSDLLVVLLASSNGYLTGRWKVRTTLFLLPFAVPGTIITVQWITIIVTRLL